MSTPVRVTDVRCPACYSKPGQLCCQFKRFVHSGPNPTVPAHEERRAAFEKAKQC